MDSSRADIRTIHLSTDSRLENVALVGLAVRGIVSGASFTEVEIHHVEVSVVEAVNNAVLHAYRGEPGHAVEVTLSLHPDRVECVISDTGAPMKGLKEDEPDEDPVDRRNLAEGGRGLAIIRAAMDEVVYGSQGGRNVMKMTKYKSDRKDRVL